MYQLFKQIFVSCVFCVCNIVTKILDLTTNITNLIFFNKSQRYVMFNKRQYQYIYSKYR